MSEPNIEERITDLEKQVKQLQRVRKAPNHECFTYKEVANMAGCSEQKIRNDEKMGLIKTRYPNAKKRFHPMEVDTYLRGLSPGRRKSL